MEKFVGEESEDPQTAYSNLLQRMPLNRSGEAANARHGGQMLAAGVMAVGMLLSGVMAFSGMPVFFPAAGFIFFLVAGYAVKLSGEIHARHVEDIQRNGEREWSLKLDIARERKDYMKLRERRRMEIERRLQEEQRRQGYEDAQKRRQDDLTKFVQDKVNSAKQFFAQYFVPVRNVSVVGQSKAIIEIPFHNAPVHRHIVDLAEAALGLRVSIIPVRFCDTCGLKHAGPMVAAPACLKCHAPLSDQTVEEAPIAGAPKPLIPTQHAIRETPLPRIPTQLPSIAQEAAVGIDAEAVGEHILQELSEEGNPEESDWTERMELERNVPQIQARLDYRNQNGRQTDHMSETPSSEIAKAETDFSTPAEAVEHDGTLPQASEEFHTGRSIADDLLERPKCSEPSLVVDHQGSVEVGSSVLIKAGPFRDNVGTVSILNKKKRSAKVQLKGFNTAVNIPLDLLSPSKPIEA